MGFERAKIEVKAPTVGTGIKVTLSTTRGSSAKMKFSITTKLAKEFGWSNGDKLEVLIGTDGDHGMLRFRKNNSTGDAVVEFRKGVHEYVSVSLGHQPKFVDRKEAGRWCQFEVLEDGFLEIILPRWADETSPSKKAVAHAPLVSVHISPENKLPLPKPVNAVSKPVTSTVMGDPPAGRREMLAKMGEMKI